MTLYDGLPVPAGRYAKPCACGAPAALVHDGRNWCVACHLDDVQAPRELLPAWVPPATHQQGRAIRRRPSSRAHLRDEHQGGTL